MLFHVMNTMQHTCVLSHSKVKIRQLSMTKAWYVV